MRVYISGLSLGPANLDKQVSLVVRNVVEESEIQGSGRIVGNPSLGINFRLAGDSGTIGQIANRDRA